MKTIVVEPDWIARKAQSIVEMIHKYQAEQKPRLLPTWFTDHLTEEIADALHYAYLRGQDWVKSGEASK